MAAPNSVTYDPQTDNAYEAKERAKLFLPLYFSTTFYYDYPKNIGGQYSDSIDNLDNSRVVNTINSGVSIINFATQGYMNANGLGDYYYHPLYGGTQPTFQHLFYYTDAEAVTNGGMLPLMEVVARVLEEEEELEVEVVVPSLLSPLSKTGLIGHLLKRTGVVVVEESHHDFGISAEIGASLLDQGFSGRFLRIGTPPVPIASARSLERQILPDEKTLIEQILDWI